jgi:hypothetical protein
MQTFKTIHDEVDIAMLVLSSVVKAISRAQV